MTKIDRILVTQAIEILEDYGIDLSQAEVEVIHSRDRTTCEVVFKQKNGLKVILSSIWWQKSTGKILQYGTNYGDLTL